MSKDEKCGYADDLSGTPVHVADAKHSYVRYDRKKFMRADERSPVIFDEDLRGLNSENSLTLKLKLLCALPRNVGSQLGGPNRFVGLTVMCTFAPL